MTYATLLVTAKPGILEIAFNRPDHQNALNLTMIQELNRALDAAQADDTNRLVVLRGRDGVFCTGMDFEEAAAERAGDLPDRRAEVSQRYMDTLTRLAQIPRIVIASVDGRAMAGGIGIVAASDLVIATANSRFSLSEALWGLLPACVTPYLIRRVGFQKAYRMTLTTLPISGQKAYDTGLVDELSDEPDDAVRRLWTRLSRLENRTIGDMKSYFRKMWMIDAAMETEAVAEITRLMADPVVRKNISDYVNEQRFPWEKT